MGARCQIPLRLIGLALTAGCGPAVPVGEADVDTGSASASSDDPFPTSGPGASDTTDDGSEPPSACEGVQGRDPLADGSCQAHGLRREGPDRDPVEVEVVNASSEPIILLGARPCEPAWLWLTGEVAGRKVTQRPWCLLDAEPCDLFLDVEPITCADACPTTFPLRLEPGVRYSVHWSPYIAVEAVLPAACSSTGSAEACTALMPVVPGDYALHARILRVADCPEPELCECELDPDGVCVLDDALNAEPGLDVTGDYDGVCNPAEVVFTG